MVQNLKGALPSIAAATCMERLTTAGPQQKEPSGNIAPQATSAFYIPLPGETTVDYPGGM